MAASAYLDQVLQIYISYLGRPAHPSGLAYWANKIDAADGSFPTVIGGFSASAESRSLYGSMCTDQVISDLRQAVQSSTGRRRPGHWKQQLDGGVVPQAQAELTILFGAQTSEATGIASRKTGFAHIAGLDSGDFINSNGALAGRQLYQ